MNQVLTRVHLHYGGDRFNYYVRFGAPAYRDALNAREAFEYYPAGAIFAYARWRANTYATTWWHISILRAGDRLTPMWRMAGVVPGADLLLDVRGKERVRHVLKAIDAIEATGIDPCTVAPCYWIQCGARINSSLPPKAYSLDLHRAWAIEQGLST